MALSVIMFTLVNCKDFIFEDNCSTIYQAYVQSNPSLTLCCSSGFRETFFTEICGEELKITDAIDSSAMAIQETIE